jgi:hypothetical protein
MGFNYFVTFLIIFFIFLYISTNFLFYYYFPENNKLIEKFVVCESKPTGPFSTHCVLSKFYNNELYAFCKNVNLNDEFYLTKLSMDDCPNDDDCYSVGVNNNGELTC